MGGKSRKITFGQIYMELLRAVPRMPPIAQCVEAVDVLVKEGLLTSERVLASDPGFPYTQHIISGLTDIGSASLDSKEEAELISAPIAFGAKSSLPELAPGSIDRRKARG